MRKKNIKSFRLDMKSVSGTARARGAAPFTKAEQRRRQGIMTTLVLASLVACTFFLGHLVLLNYGHARSTALQATHHISGSTPGGHYLYYVLKEPQGFVLARALAGNSNQPLETPSVVASFGNGFGQSTTDGIISLQLSPDGHYLAIDGTRSDGELLWLFNTSQMTLKLEPASVSGTFLNWLPGSSDAFLYRPMFPRGPDAPLDNGVWNPGMWKINAASGNVTDIDIHVPSADLVDAIPSPDGSQILYSTSAGLGLGSEIWSMDAQGQHQTLLLHFSGNAQSIAGLLSWSPDGQTIAYERLADSPTPFLPASIWLMNRQGGNQHFLAQADGGHGFALIWSPDSKQVAFVSRTNPDDGQADQNTQALKSAVEVINLASQKVTTLANPALTGMQINASPTWDTTSSIVTFAAYNPLNPVLGGTIHYWSVSAQPGGTTPALTEIAQPVTHVIALA
jgi:Tol biopolymer transport system component